jgi:hypothetical protein
MVLLLYYVKAPNYVHDDPYAGLTAAYTIHLFFNPSVTLQLRRHLDGHSNFGPALVL